MFYREYRDYQSLYRNGISRIKYECFDPKIEIKDDPKFILKQSDGSFDLVFSPLGRLLEKSEKNEKRNHKYLFYYNKEGILIRITKVELQTNILIGETKFKYSIDGKMISETYSECRKLNSRQKVKQKHTYYENIKKIRFISSLGNDFNATWTFIYDEEGRVIEEKMELDKDGFLCCNRREYDDVANSVTTYKVNEERKSAELSHIETYNENELISTCSYPSKNNCLLKYQYVYDERGNWIQMNTFDDDILQYHTIREITYYPQTSSKNR